MNRGNTALLEFEGLWRRLVVSPYAMRALREGERIPPWYYGHAYWDYERELSYWYPLPLNYLVRWALWLKGQWNRFRRQGPVWVDATRVEEVLHKRYWEGVEYGERRTWNLIEIASQKRITRGMIEEATKQP